MTLAAKRARAHLMGIVNVTPDSFSDGGKYLSPDAAIAHGLQLVADGATWLDVGAESTRPHASSVEENEEWRRLEPVLLAARQYLAQTPLSVDTRRPSIAEAALHLGVQAINDVSAQTNEDMLRLARSHQVPLVFMHGFPALAQTDVPDQHVSLEVDAIFKGLQERASDAISAGLKREQIWLDPGLGFGKSSRVSEALLERLQELVEYGYPVMVGPSRKRFLRREGEAALDLHEQDRRSALVCHKARNQGATILRLHNPKALSELDELHCRASHTGNA